MRTVRLLSSVVAAIALLGGPAAAADLHWRGAIAAEGLYTDNVYFKPDSPPEEKISSSGMLLDARLGFSSQTPRSQLDFDYRPAYRYYSSSLVPDTSEHYLSLKWNAAVSQRTNLQLQEAASYSPEVDNFQARGADLPFVVGLRARQTRSATTLGMTWTLSPRWSLGATYVYRLLNNGKIQQPPADGGAAPPPAVVLLDEETHNASLTATYQLSQLSDLQVKGAYTLNRFEESLFGQAVRTTDSPSLMVTYERRPGPRLRTWVGAGAFRATTDVRDPALGGTANRASNRVSGAAGLDFSSERSVLSVGVSRALSTFEGIVRATKGGGGTAVAGSAGDATTSMLHTSYRYQVPNGASVVLAINGTRRDSLDRDTVVSTAGAALSGDLPLARWAALRAFYAHTRQWVSGTAIVSLNEFSKNTAALGVVFSTPATR